MTPRRMPCVVVPAGASAPGPVLVTRPPIFLVVVGFLVFVLVLLLGAGFVRGVARGRFLVLVLLLGVVVVAGRGFGGDGPVGCILIFAGVVVEVVALVAAERDEVILRIFRLLGVRAFRRQLCRACLFFPGESHGDRDVGLGLGIHRRPPGGVAVRRGGLRAVSRRDFDPSPAMRRRDRQPPRTARRSPPRRAASCRRA